VSLLRLETLTISLVMPERVPAPEQLVRGGTTLNPLFEPARHWVLPDADNRGWCTVREDRVAQVRGQLAAIDPASLEDKEALDLILSARPATFAELALLPTFYAWLVTGRGDPVWSGSLQTFALDVALCDGIEHSATVPVDPVVGISLPLQRANLRPVAATESVACTASKGRIASPRLEVEPWPTLRPGLSLHPPELFTRRRAEAIGDPLLAWINPGLSAFVDEIGAALAALDAWAPQHAREVTRWTSGVVALHRLDPNIHVSSSSSELPGLLFLCGEPVGWAQAEAMVHEAAHQRLDAAFRIAPLFKPGLNDAIYASPWRSDPRPIRGVLAGVHAFVAVADLLTFCPDPSSARVEALCRAVATSEDGLALLERHARWTDEGRALHAALSDALHASAAQCELQNPEALAWARERAAERRRALEGQEAGVHRDIPPRGTLAIAAARSEDGTTLRVDIELDPRLLEDGGQAAFEDRLSEQMGVALGRLLRS
jgi:HEXXH motif-containing protein